MPQDQQSRQEPQDLHNKQELEKQFRKDFDGVRKKLQDLQNEVQTETNTSKKEEKNKKLQELLNDARDLWRLLNRFSDLNEEDLKSVKTRLDSLKATVYEFTTEISEYKQEKINTPTTYLLLKDSETYNRLIKIISSYPDKFKDLPWNTPELKLEHIFSKVRENMVLFLQNKLWDKEKYNDIINNTIAPAFEWNLLELLRDNWNEANVGMLQEMNKIPLVDGFKKLVWWVTDFAKSATWSYAKFSQWINSIDYLSVHNEVLSKPNKSAVLSNPIEFQNYMNEQVFSSSWFSPYTPIDGNIFKIDENQDYNFEMSMQQIADLKSRIWNIQVVDSPNTTSLITKILNKSDGFFGKVPQLQDTANHLLDIANGMNNVTKMFWVDIMWEITKPPERRGFTYRIIDFVCKLIGITWWIEWIVKKWRLDRLNLTSEKNENISEIFTEYQKAAWKWPMISITDASTCWTILEYFNLTADLNAEPSSKWDYLREAIAKKINLNLISPNVVKQTLWDDYLKKTTTVIDWKQHEKIEIDYPKINDEEKRILAHKHITNMKSYFWSNYNNLRDFYSNIRNLDDLIICTTASLYANQDDIVQWIKAKVFLPENYGVTYESTWSDNSWDTWTSWESSENWWTTSWTTSTTEWSQWSKETQVEEGKEWWDTVSDEMFKELLIMEGSQNFVAKTNRRDFWENFVTWPYWMVYKHIDRNGNLLKTPIGFDEWERVSKDWAEKNARAYYNKKAKEWSDLLKSKWYEYTKDMLDALVSASWGTKKSVDRLKEYVLSNRNDKKAISQFISSFATTSAWNWEVQKWLVTRRKFESNWFQWIKHPYTEYQRNMRMNP